MYVGNVCYSTHVEHLQLIARGQGRFISGRDVRDNRVYLQSLLCVAYLLFKHCLDPFKMFLRQRLCYDELQICSYDYLPLCLW